MKNNVLSRIELLAKNEDITITALERVIGASKGVLSRAIAKGTTIQSKWIQIIVENYPLYNSDWLFTGKGPMLKQDSSALASPAPAGVGLPLIPIEAFCGYGTVEFDDLQIEEYYFIREFKDADFLIRVKGNSMYPKYSSGDIIACKKILETLFFQWNKIYAIYTRSQGVMVKRVKKSTMEGYILLVSDNEKYEPFDVPLSDIEAIALVIGVIRVE